MKIKILTVGTRGDVQPFVALGKGHRTDHCLFRRISEKFQVDFPRADWFLSIFEQIKINSHPDINYKQQDKKDGCTHNFTITLF